jgi:hypothetical protein
MYIEMYTLLIEIFFTVTTARKEGCRERTEILDDVLQMEVGGNSSRLILFK